MLLKSFKLTYPQLLRLKNISETSITGKPSTILSCSFLHSRSSRMSQALPRQDIIEDTSDADKIASRAIIDTVNQHIAKDPGRLFAIIQILSKQYRVVENDVILIERNWAPEQNDKLIFEKVLLVGGSSFSLIGRPVLPKNLVRVSGTIVHKDLTHTKLRYFTIPKERCHKLNFVREELTYIRINTVKVFPKINVASDTEFLRC